MDIAMFMIERNDISDDDPIIIEDDDRRPALVAAEEDFIFGQYLLINGRNG